VKITLIGFLKAEFEEVAQQNAGETVIITITAQDGTSSPVTAVTDSKAQFSVDIEEPVGEYSAVAHIDKDADFTAADSPALTIDVELIPRTITLQRQA
jgi:hypothetical protein